MKDENFEELKSEAIKTFKRIGLGNCINYLIEYLAIMEGDFHTIYGKRELHQDYLDRTTKYLQPPNIVIEVDQNFITISIDRNQDNNIVVFAQYLLTKEIIIFKNGEWTQRVKEFVQEKLKEEVNEYDFTPLTEKEESLVVYI